MKTLHRECIILITLTLLCQSISAIRGLLYPSSSAPAPVFLVLPGFGNSDRDYREAINRRGSSLLGNMETRGCIADVVPLARIQWLGVLKGLFTLEWYKRECQPAILFDFYFKEVKAKINEIHLKHPKSKIILLCHSAGGWLARGLLADGSLQIIKDKNSQELVPVEDIIAGIVSLGTPHIPPNDPSYDMTHGAWSAVNQRFPGTYLKKRIKYVTVAGTAVRASKQSKSGSAQGFAYRSYKTVRGELLDSQDFVGDGVTPLSAAHLDGAIQITIPEAYHGPTAPNDMWFGGNDVIDKWLVPTKKIFGVR